MIPINIDCGGIVVRNIEMNELDLVLDCVNESSDNLQALGRKSEISIEDLKQRYIETLINSMEFFCGIYQNNVMIGIIKGRIENKNPKELCILSFVLLKKYRRKGMGSRVIGCFEKYFESNYSIKNFCAMVMKDNLVAQRFWVKNHYKLTRITQGVTLKEEMGISIFEKKGGI